LTRYKSSFKNRFFENDRFPLVFLAVLVFMLFFDFFSKGYVLDANHDVRQILVPLHIFKLHAVQGLAIPQWNPYIHCGTVFMGSGIDTLYYPPLLLAYLFPERHIYLLTTIIMVVHVYMAGLFSYMLFKKITGDRFWALLSSVIYLFSSSSIINMTVSNMCFAFLVFLPLWLYLVYTRKERGYLKNLTFTTLTLSLFFLIGMSQRIMYTVWFVFLFILFESFTVSGKRVHFDPRPFLTNILSVLIALSVSAIRILPFLANSGEGITAGVPFKKAFEYGYVPFQAFLRFFSPEFFGTKLHREFLFDHLIVKSAGKIDFIMEHANHLETFCCYAGIAAAFISLYALFFIRGRKTLFWKTAFILILLIVFTKPFNFLHYIFTMRSPLCYGRLVWLIPICAAALVGTFGSLYWKDRQKIRGLRIFSCILFPVCCAVLLFLYSYYSHKEFAFHILSAMRFSIIYFSIVTILFILLLSAQKEIMKYLLLAFIVFDLLFIARIDSNNSLPFLSPVESFRKYSDAELQASNMFKKNNGGFRIQQVLSDGTSTNECIKLGFYTGGGNDSFCSPYLARLYTGVYDLGHDRSAQAASWPRSSLALNLSSTAIILRPGQTLINRSSRFVPRVKLYGAYIVIKNDLDAFKKITSDVCDPSTVLILDRVPLIDMPEPGPNDGGKVHIVKEENERVIIDTESRVNSILLLTDTYRKGWKAYVDGEETEIMRANYAFRAVSVPSGRHTVEFVFKHPAFKISVLVSIIGTVVLLILISLLVAKSYFWAGRLNKI